MAADYEIIEFRDSSSFRSWLSAHHTNVTGIWLRIFKKATNTPTVTHAEALDEALCYGWIDGQRKSYDDLSFLQKFTPRRPRSLWSKRNIEHIERLRQSGQMTPSGEAEVRSAQDDGRWAAAYDAPSQAVPPADLILQLQQHPIAQERFDTLSKTARYSIIWELQTAKTEATRQRRLAKILSSLIDPLD